MGTNSANPRVTTLLQAVTGVEVLVLLAAGVGLLLIPATLGEIWPWRLTPFNAAFLGAVYTTSMASTALLVLIGRWSPARVVVPMILVFSAVVLAVSLAHLDRFALASPATWLWFLLYVAIPLNAAYHVWLYRDLPPVGGQLIRPLRALVLTEAIALGLYGLGLLAAPATFTAFWPWPIDAFHGRVYSVVFLTPAIGLWLLARSAAWPETFAMAVTLIVGGVLAILALAAVDAQATRVNWSDAGTWLWIGIFGIIALTGAALLLALRALPRPAGPLNEAALVVPLPATAFVLGVAFVAAGIAGFLPAFTHPAPHGAPPLIVPAAYGYLLGLYPVNAIHSLFHLTLGVLGLAAFARPAWARAYVRGFAVALAALTVMGLLPGLNIAFGLAPLYGHDVWLHGVEALAAGYIGFVMPGTEAARRTTETVAAA